MSKKTSLYKIYFIVFLYLSLNVFWLGMYFLVNDKDIFLEINLLSLNSTSVSMTVLLDWMSLTFMSFVLFISFMKGLPLSTWQLWNFIVNAPLSQSPNCQRQNIQ